MRKILVIMAIICGCTWFGGYVEAKDYTFQLINQHAKRFMRGIRINGSSVTAILVHPGNTSDKIVLQPNIGSSVEIKRTKGWTVVISNFDDYDQWSFIDITMKPDGTFAVSGRN